LPATISSFAQIRTSPSVHELIYSLMNEKPAPELSNSEPPKSPFKEAMGISNAMPDDSKANLSMPLSSKSTGTLAAGRKMDVVVRKKRAFVHVDVTEPVPVPEDANAILIRKAKQAERKEIEEEWNRKRFNACISHLIALAREGKTTRSWELCQSLFLEWHTKEGMDTLQNILIDINKRTWSDYKVLLGALVGDTDFPPEGLPGKYFFDYAQSIGLVVENKPEFIATHIVELQKVFLQLRSGFSKLNQF
jgi:hypothetical protein